MVERVTRKVSDSWLIDCIKCCMCGQIKKYRNVNIFLWICELTEWGLVQFFGNIVSKVEYLSDRFFQKTAHIALYMPNIVQAFPPQIAQNFSQKTIAGTFV